MDLDKIDWLLVSAVVIGAIASAAREVVNFIGIDDLNSIILAIKLVAAVLTLVFAILKFFKLKPFIADFKLGASQPDGKITIPAKNHKKGKSPSFKVFELEDDGSVESIFMDEVVDANGNITLSGNFLTDFNIRVIVKK